jgi:hypothetical protein
MATDLFANAAQTTLTAQAAVGDVTFTVASSAAFPFPTAGQYRAVATPPGQGVTSEFVLVTAAPSGTSVTVTRAQEGSTAQTLPIGTTLSHVLTAGWAASLLKKSDGDASYTSVAPGSGLTPAVVRTNPASPQAVPLRRVMVKVAAINAGTPSRVKVCTFGDSYGQKVYGQIAPLLARMFGGTAGSINTGVSGTGALAISNTTGAVTDNLADFDASVTGQTTTYTTGGNRTYASAAQVTDTLKVYYVIEDPANNKGGGTFKLQVNGVDAAGFTNVSAAGAGGSNPTLGIATVTPTRASNTLTIVNLTGKVRVLHVGMEDSLSSGLMSINVGVGGLCLDDAMQNANARAIFSAFLADQSPDLMTFEMKEASVYSGVSSGSTLNSGLTYQQRLTTFFAATTAGAPLMDIIAIGTPAVSENGSGNQADILVQNTQLLAATQAAGQIFYDTYALFKASMTSTPAQDWAVIVAEGWQGDGTHIAAAADQLRGMALMRDLGLLTLYGRRFPLDLNAAKAQTDQVIFNALGAATPEGVFKSDTLSNDVYFLGKRYLRGYEPTQATEYWRLATDNGRLSYVPTYCGFGAGKAKIVGLGARVLGVVGGDNDNNYGDVQARSLAALVQTLNGVSGAVSIDLNNGALIVLNLTGNITSLAFTNAGTTGQEVTLHFVQDATGGRTLAGVSGSVKPATTGLTLAAAATKRDVVKFQQIGGSFYQITPLVTQA